MHNIKLTTLISFLNVQCITVKYFQDFPGGLVAKNPCCNAGPVASTLGWGAKSPYAMERLSPPATVTEAPVPWSPHTLEAEHRN